MILYKIKYKRMHAKTLLEYMFRTRQEKKKKKNFHPGVTDHNRYD